MRQAIKKFFIPHAENDYHPHILHSKRAIFYSAFFVSLKIILFIFALALPSTVFVLPDVLALEQKKIVTLTNALRAQKNLPILEEVFSLNESAQNKAEDMAKYSYFSHNSPSNKTVGNWAKSSGYNYSAVGENLAMGFSSAEDVVAAWEKSATHLANMIDRDFMQVGVGMQYGTYAEAPTVFVAEHFGSPAKAKEKAENPNTNVGYATGNADSAKPAETAQAVLSQKETSVTTTLAAEVTIDFEHSRLYWQENSGKTLLTANVRLLGVAESVRVAVEKYEFPLEPSNNGSYKGSLLIAESPEQFFKVIMPPTVKIVGVDGKENVYPLRWYSVKVVSPTPLEIYTKSRDYLAPISNIFSVSNWIFLSAIAFFAATLFLSIVIEIKKQHPHIIVQTSALLCLLVVLLFI